MDELVTLTVVGRLAQPDAVSLLVRTTSDDGEIRQLSDKRDSLRAKLIGAQSDYLEDRITIEQRDLTTATLRPRLDRVESMLGAALEAVGGEADLVDLCRDDIAEIWDQVPLERQRAAIAALLTIRVLPLGRGQRWNPRSVDVKLRKGRHSAARTTR